ncbi:hypothetical protein HRbin15_02386 [bacterium HR15]|nr:hypothetical protein HRbin15_02386 [bacterium HR15]
MRKRFRSALLQANLALTSMDETLNATRLRSLEGVRKKKLCAGIHSFSFSPQAVRAKPDRFPLSRGNLQVWVPHQQMNFSNSIDSDSYQH